MDIDLLYRSFYKAKRIYSNYPLLSYHKFDLKNNNDMDTFEKGRLGMLEINNLQITPNFLEKQNNLYLKTVINMCKKVLKDNKLEPENFVLKVSKCSNNNNNNLQLNTTSDIWKNNIKSKLTSIFYLRNDDVNWSLITNLQSFNERIPDLSKFVFLKLEKDVCINFFGGNYLNNMYGEFIKIEYYLKTDNIIGSENCFLVENDFDETFYTTNQEIDDVIHKDIDIPFINEVCIKKNYTCESQRHFLNEIAPDKSIVITFNNNAGFDTNITEFSIPILDNDHYKINNECIN
mgnify:CR=1 FL=1